MSKAIDYKLLLAKYMAIIIERESHSYLGEAGDCSPGITSEEDNIELLKVRDQLFSAEINTDKYDWSKLNESL